MFETEVYQNSSFPDLKCTVFASLIETGDQVFKNGENSLHQQIIQAGLAKSIGLYFYLYQMDNARPFIKIGEVSGRKGIANRLKRGWLGTTAYSDSYKKPEKQMLNILARVTKKDPILFVFYEFPVSTSFPKIDEIQAFAKHKDHFGESTLNKERVNSYSELGVKLTWRPESFDEVLRRTFPSGRKYFSRVEMQQD